MELPENIGNGHVSGYGPPGDDSNGNARAPLPVRPPRPRECETIAEVIDLYMAHELKTLGKATAMDRKRDLGRFKAACGHLTVAEARPFDLVNYLNDHPQWLDWSRYRIVLSIKRALNWALDMELVQRNPFGRVRHRKGERRGPMSDEHLQALLRAATPLFRRFLVMLAFSGARPIEICSARWSDVHFDEGVIRLKTHKTSKKTGKPRTICLVPTTLKLLLWMRRHRPVSTAELVERLLLPGPMKVVDLAYRMKRYGVTHTAVVRARAALGVEKKRIGSTGPDGYYVYQLPKGYMPRMWHVEDHLFLNYDGKPWQRPALNLRIRRIRKKVGLLGVPNTSLYSLRHRWGLKGVKAKVNLKLLSLSMGHADVRTTEIYIAESGLGADVKEAAVAIAYGAGARAMLPPPPPERSIPTIPPPPPAEQIPIETEQLSAPNGIPTRPTIPIVRSPEAIAANGSPLESMMAALLQRLDERPNQHGRRPPTGIRPDALTPSQEMAWRSYVWALAKEPVLAKVDDRVVYEWLQGCPDFPGTLPPTIVTWCRYLSVARLFHGITKRPELNGRPTILPRAEPEPAGPDTAV